jgi:glycosyltransferase involved in cell wall biosynthesis
VGTITAPGPRILYLVYWGAGEPLGQALVLPSVKRLAELGAAVTLVTFDKVEDLRQHEYMAAIRCQLGALGIRWISLRYHRRSQVPAKVYDAINGWAHSLAAQLGGRTDIVHARTFLGGLMGLVLARLLRAKFVYHNEGFYPDEQVDGGVWAPGSRRHRIARQLEAQLYARADGIMALSHRARATIKELAPVRRKRTPVIVVPSAVDLERFRCAKYEGGIHPGGLRLVYTGSVGLRYRLDRAAQFAAVALQELGQVSLRVLSRADRSVVEGILEASSLPRDSWSVDSVPHAAMPGELSRHDAGLFFLTEGLSEQGCSPTKIGEYWACGLPVVTTPNVSDTDEIVRREGVGVVVKEHSEAGYSEAIRTLAKLLADPELKARCRRAAETHYALGPACERQMALYRELLA